MVKVTLRPIGNYRGTGIVYRVKSTTNHTGWYFVAMMFNAEGESVIECSCTGFQVHHKCWHSESVIEWETERLSQVNTTTINSETQSQVTQENNLNEQDQMDSSVENVIELFPGQNSE